MIAKELIMVRPATAESNIETKLSNRFQSTIDSSPELLTSVLEEFDAMVALLETNGVDICVHDAIVTTSMDSVFPNNWISFHKDKVITYPMLAPSRQAEINGAVINEAISRGKEHIDLSMLAQDGHFLEGTGSMVLDREHRTAYIARSPRSTQEGMEAFSQSTGYDLCVFDAFGPFGEPIYHTNVMMGVGIGFSLIGLETISERDRNAVLARFERDGIEPIELTNDQVYTCFAGNVLQAESAAGERLLLMSAKADRSLTKKQRDQCLRFNDKIVSFEIPTIELIGGGSVRCMLAEKF